MRKVTVTITDENGNVLATQEGTVRDGITELVVSGMIPPSNRVYDHTVACLTIGDGGGSTESSPGRSTSRLRDTH